MVRVKKAVNALKTRKNVLKRVKGYRFSRSKKERAAYEAIAHAGAYAFAHRRDKKGVFRREWNVKINAALRPLNMSYSKVHWRSQKAECRARPQISRSLGEFHPDSFAKVVKQVA